MRQFDFEAGFGACPVGDEQRKPARNGHARLGNDIDLERPQLRFDLTDKPFSEFRIPDFRRDIPKGALRLLEVAQLVPDLLGDSFDCFCCGSGRTGCGASDWDLPAEAAFVVGCATAGLLNATHPQIASRTLAVGRTAVIRGILIL